MNLIVSHYFTKFVCQQCFIAFFVLVLYCLCLGSFVGRDLSAFASRKSSTVPVNTKTFVDSFQRQDAISVG